MARPPLTVVGYVHMKDGRIIPVDELTPEEREQVKKSMTERLENVMSDYYRQHPEEFARI